MAIATAGISSLGALVGYATGASTSIPTSFTCLERCNSIGGISLSTNQIDASALEDSVSKFIAGRADTGGEWTLSFNISDSVYTQLTAMINAYKAIMSSATDVMWFTVWSPYMQKAYYVIAQPPLAIPMPDINQNELEVVELTLSIVEYKGMETAVKPTIAE